MKTAILIFYLSFLFSASPSWAGMDAATHDFLNSLPPPCDTHQVSDCPLDICAVHKGCSGKDECMQKFVPAKDMACGPAGYYGQGIDCCAGLTRRCQQVISGEECSTYPHSLPTCVPCGNGTCDVLENKCNCPEDCKPTSARPKIKYVVPPYNAPSRAPDIGVSYDKKLMQEDVSAKLKEAYEKSDASICDKLLDIKVEQRSGGDYVYNTPSRQDYVAYCRVLAARDASRCKSLGIAGFGVNNTRADAACGYFFEAVAETQNTSPQFCREQYGKTYFSLDNVKNCYSTWEQKLFGRTNIDEIAVAETIEPFTALDLNILKCLDVHYKWVGNTKNETADKCFFELATKYKQADLCKFIYQPSGEFQYTREKCISQNNHKP